MNELERAIDDPYDTVALLDNDILPFDPIIIDFNEDKKEFWTKN